MVTPHLGSADGSISVFRVSRFDLTLLDLLRSWRGTTGDNQTTDIREGADGDTDFPNCLPSPPAVFQIRFAVAMK